MTTPPSQYDAVRQLIEILEEDDRPMDCTVFEDTYTYRPQYEKGKPPQWCALWRTHYGTIGPPWIYDAPAKVFLDGQREWYLDGRLHRDPKKGPAVLTSDGTKYYFLNGVEVDANADADSVVHLWSGRGFPSAGNWIV